ncbi:hypothetical protein EC988_006064, partial [Linderina pennispora]
MDILYLRPYLNIELPIIECRASEEFAHEIGAEYIPSNVASRQISMAFGCCGGVSHHHGSCRANLEPVCIPVPIPVPVPTHTPPPLPTTASVTAVPPRPHTAHSSPRLRSHEATEASLCRNNLFPSAVKKQSRCLSMLLQQGPHGGIRRVGPLLITCERGGRAIELLNPAFIDMMDIQPVDTETTAMLNKSNIRRRSFSLPPHEHTADWYAAIANIVASQGLASQTPVETKNGTADESTGPGMWWPLNDDNCSDEIVYDVHFSADLADSTALHDTSRTAHTAPPTRADSSSSLAPPAPLLAESQQQQDRRRGSVSSHMRTTNGHAAPSLLKTQSSMSTLARGTATLTRSVSDMSADQSGSAANNKQQPASGGSQLIEMTMKTESGTITRCVKSMSLRLLVNRLASPEGNVDSDLLTDFLNSYRFFAHPIDVMRLLIVRYLNCFAPCSSHYDDGSDDDGDDSSFEEDGCRFLTINGWKTRMPQEADSVRDSKPSSPSTSCSRELPPLARKDGAIVQLRVMNIIKNWIKFHPHDFRLHHRLTRLLLLFLSHIQKQPGRADFVNSIRHKLSSGKLLAVENPPFMV